MKIRIEAEITNNIFKHEKILKLWTVLKLRTIFWDTDNPLENGTQFKLLNKFLKMRTNIEISKNVGKLEQISKMWAFY